MTTTDNWRRLCGNASREANRMKDSMKIQTIDIARTATLP